MTGKGECMFRLYGFFTQNTMKTLYVLEAVAADYEYEFVNLGEREQRRKQFLQMNPVGKVPVLEHDGEYLFESGAICRYVANVLDSPLYPADKLARARVDQWMDFFTCHLGRWFTNLFYENVIKPKFNLGGPDEDSVAEALKFAHQQLGMLDELLATTDWLANDAMSIADLFAYAYVEQYRAIDFSMDDYPNVIAWFNRLDALDCVAAARARIPS